MEVKVCHILLFLLAVVCHLPAQRQGVSLSFHHLEKDDGLSQAANYQFFQDSRDFIWISTAEGLNRFDGRHVLRFANDPADAKTLSEDQVTSACMEDSNGDLWFTTFSAVQCYHRKSGAFESWSLPKSALQYYYAFHLDTGGQLWLRIGAADEASLYLFDTRRKTFTQKCAMEGNRCQVVLDQQQQPTCLIETQLPFRNGFVWRSLQTGVAQHLEFLKTADGQPRFLSGPSNAVLVANDSLVWMGVYNGLGVFNPKTGACFVETKTVASITKDIGNVYGIASIDAAHLLVTCSFGLAVFDIRNRIFTELIQAATDDPLGLKKGTYEELYLDHSRNLWCSNNGRGVSFANLDKRKFSALPALQGLALSSIFEDPQGNIWCASEENGVYVFNRQAQPAGHSPYLDNADYPGVQFPMPPVQYFFRDDEGLFWAGYDNNLMLWDAAKKTFRFYDALFFGMNGSSAERISSYCRLQDGRMLVTQGKDVKILIANPKQVILQSWQDLSDFHLQITTAVFQDKRGRIYVADQTERLLVLEEKAGKLQLLRAFEHVGACNSFLEPSDSLILAATSKGLLRIETKTLDAKLLQEATDGAPNDFFYQVLVDKAGFVWLSGTNGLLRYDPVKKAHHRFSKADGLTTAGAGAGLFIARSTGEFWLGGRNGLNIFQPENITLMSGNPKVFITQILVNDVLLSLRPDDETAALNLGYEDNTLAFRFAALDFSDPGANQFYYRLAGFENNWVSNGNADMVRYPNLPPGHYTFEVKASNSDGVMQDSVRRLPVVIRPPFWQTWWFYLLCTLSIAGLIYAWFQYRLRQALKIERMRVQISSDLHDDVGTLLAGLAMQSEALALTAADKDKSKLQRISEISRNAMAHMRDTVWAIDARKDKLENLLDRVREHAEETLSPRDIRFDVQVENVSMKQNLPTSIRQNLYLICKEAITNAAKHSNGDMVLVSLKKEAEGFELRISDNGSVAEKTYKTTGLGTSNMQMRSEKIGGKLEISRENGFCLTLRLPSLG